MKKWIFITLAAFAVLVFACNKKKKPIHLKKPPQELQVAAPAKSELAGKKLLYDFNTSYFEITVKNDSILNWRCVAGKDKGLTEDVRYYRHDVSKGIMMISWIDKEQRNISQTLNFNTDSVKTFIQLKDRVLAVDGSMHEIAPVKPAAINKITSN